MLVTFTAREDISDDFYIEGECLPVELFRYLKEGILDAFRVDFIEERFQITLSGDNKDDNITALVITYSDGPESAEYHIAS